MADDVDNFVMADCDVIVLINADQSVVSNAVREAAAQGIYVISDESGYMEGVSTVIGMNNYAIGAEMAMDVLSAINYDGKVVTTGHNDHPTIRGHYKVFDLLIEEYPMVEKVGTVYTSYPGTTEITYNGISALLAEHPDLKAVIASQDIEAMGVIQATKEMGLYPNVICTGIDGEWMCFMILKWWLRGIHLCVRHGCYYRIDRFVCCQAGYGTGSGAFPRSSCDKGDQGKC